MEVSKPAQEATGGDAEQDERFLQRKSDRSASELLCKRAKDTHLLWCPAIHVKHDGDSTEQEEDGTPQEAAMESRVS